MLSTQRWSEQGLALLQILLVASFSKSEERVCSLMGEPEEPQLFKTGDIILGGIFSFHSSYKTVESTYMHRPLPLQCIRAIQFAQVMLFAIEEINNSTDILPGIKLGVTSSSPSMAISTVIGPFHTPLVSHYATCACLSNKVKYPSFLRTIPSDYYQSRALAQMVKHFGWTWVIIGFLNHMDMDILIEEFAHHNLTGFQWVGTEGWISDSQNAQAKGHYILDGSIGLAIRKAHVTGLRDFILDVKPLNSSGNKLFTEFWEKTFGTYFSLQWDMCFGNSKGPPERKACLLL
ncbi:unnamed protein product [Boreogadus saida]